MMGHYGTDRSSFVDRANRYGVLENSNGGENIFYGVNDPFLVVLSWIIDDGVPTRGHRKNIFNPAHTQVGAHVCPHKSANYSPIYVAVFATSFRDSNLGSFSSPTSNRTTTTTPPPLASPVNITNSFTTTITPTCTPTSTNYHPHTSNEKYIQTTSANVGNFISTMTPTPVNSGYSFQSQEQRTTPTPSSTAQSKKSNVTSSFAVKVEKK
eukprot:TRINITY_DN1107_c0_g1_i2.p1 TRINITY_DN1107_c0_g1~~TRINITY_DN1107_c0_g1_i2.p1  ORF type:complete len:210 (+),score=40.08 TRINITY_DN1107_c0_g1_i2:345-974(+)